MKTTLLDVQKAEPRLLDFNSAAMHLGVSRSIVRQLVDSGQPSRVLLPNPRRPNQNLDPARRDTADQHSLILVVAKACVCTTPLRLQSVEGRQFCSAVAIKPALKIIS
jgi:hypothetical protein